MTNRQKDIGDKLLKFLSEKGQANTDEYFHHLTEECGFKDFSDQGQIGLVKALLLKLNLIEPVGNVDNFLMLTANGLKAAGLGITQWMEQNQSPQRPAKTTIKDKRITILKGLYEKRFDGRFYDLQQFLNTANTTEVYQIARALEEDGLIKMAASKDSVHGEITSRGVELIESDEIVGHEYQPSDKFSKQEAETIRGKIDELGERLSRLEVGQQITYDDLLKELEDLKNLLGVLGKKNWSQVLKGKLLDAGFGAITDKVSELIIEIFKEDKLLNN